MSPSGPVARAEIIAVGSELLAPPRLDTNSLFITERLAAAGVEVRVKLVVGDRRDDIETLVRQALDRADFVILTGGLGPTDDDLTRDAVAAALGRPLREDAAVLERIRERFAARGARMPDVNRRQALVPEGAEVIENRAGTAPGLWIGVGDRVVILLPGPPGELRPMFDQVMAARIVPRAGDGRVFTRVVRVCGRTESEVEECAFPVYSAWRDDPLPITTTVLTAPAVVDLHLSVRCGDGREAVARLDEAAGQLKAVLGDDLFSDGGRPMEAVVGDLLRERACRIGVAESCTGGLISAMLTDVPGSSDYVSLNVTCYSNEAKTRVLGVPETLLAEHGAVSEAVALAMAAGIRAPAGAEIGVGVTGIAGPAGGSDLKPVGTVVIAVVAPWGQTVRTYRFPFSRTRVRQFASLIALDLVRRMLLGAAPGRAFVWLASPAAGSRP